MNLLAGIHGFEGRHIVPPGGFCLDVIGISENPAPKDYAAAAPGVRWITRLSWGFHGAGNIPKPAQYAEFASRCALYVEGSRGCRIWSVGNEPNHAQERPGGELITPEQYVQCFRLVRATIKRVQADAIVVPAPVAPYNVETGDWLEYQSRVWQALGPHGCDGLGVHAYIRSNDPADVTSDARMGAPFADRHSQFRTYRDSLNRVPATMRHLPVYLLEGNPLPGWENGEIMPAMLQEISQWNQGAGTQKIQCVIFYRYPRFDQWHIEGKSHIIDAFREAAPRYPSSPPIFVPPPQPPKPPAPPQPPTPPATPPATGRDWDSRLDKRGVKIETPDLQAGQQYWRVIRGQWFDLVESGGRHHIYVDTLDADGKRQTGVPLLVNWPDGSHRIVTEAKPGEPWATNFPMSPSRNEFSVRVADNLPSERVTGIGMGEDTPGGWNSSMHTSTGLVFQLTKSAPKAVVPAIPRPQPEPVAVPPPATVTVPALTHPVAEPAHRRITQGWGKRPEYYSRFVYGGVPLRGHNGLDYATPVGAIIQAVDGGWVVEARFDEGWGNYVKIMHPWGESLYAHLQTFLVVVGATVAAGQPIALSGNSGNSTGPHLHYGMRVNPYERSDGWGGFVNPLPYLSNADTPESPVEPAPPADIVTVVREAAREFGVDENLLLSLIWKESSYNPRAVNPASQAKGLGQFMDATWMEWSVKTGAADVFNARDNARTTAAYLRWLIQTAGGERRGLWAYVWGIGRTLNLGKPGQPTQPPQEVIEYASAIIHGRDLLDQVLP